MNCYYHPERPSVAQCATCGKNLCTECVIVKEGENYCKECLGVGEVHVDTEKILLPALICGVSAGLLSIIPLVFPGALGQATDVLGCSCCLWIPLAGGVAVYLLKRFNNITGKITMGKAALTGGLAGLTASLILAGTLITILGGLDMMDETRDSAEVEEALRDSGLPAEDLESLEEMMPGFIALGFFIVFGGMVVLLSLFAVLGGIISNEVTK